MKRLLVLTLFLLAGSLSSFAATFEQAFQDSDRKPMLVLLYATWADGYQSCINSFRQVEAELGQRFNYVELDIASKDAKSFNKKYSFDQNLPYVMIYRNMGKVSRRITTECAMSPSCMIPKIKAFLQ